MSLAPHSPQNKASPSKKNSEQEYLDSSRKRTRIIMMILLACMFIIAGIYSSWILLIMFAMLPSLLIRQIQLKEGDALIISVTGLNFVGLMLALQHSYGKYGINPKPGLLFSDVFNWIVPFGMAWLGVLIFVSFPIVMAIILEINLQSKEQRLRKQQKTLLQDWGGQIKHDSEKDKGKSKSEM